MTSKTKTGLMRALLISAFTITGLGGTALVYGSSPLDIAQAGGCCTGERCFLHGQAHQCIKGLCTPDIPR